MEKIQSGRLGPALASNSPAAAEREEGSAPRGAAEQDAVPPSEGMGHITYSSSFHVT